MDRRCAKRSCQANVYKHFSPRRERDIRPALPIILPAKDEEEIRKPPPKPIARNNISIKGPINQRKKSTDRKSVAESSLSTRKKFNVSQPVPPKKKNVPNSLRSQTDPGSLYSCTSFCSTTKRICPSPCTIDGSNSKISYNSEYRTIQQNHNKESSPQEDSPREKSNSGGCDDAVKLILDRMDSCKSSNTITCKYIESLRNEIRSFASPKCSQFTDDLDNLKREISEFRKAKDEKFHDFYKKLEALGAPPCVVQSQIASTSNKKSEEDKDDRGKVNHLTRSKAPSRKSVKQRSSASRKSPNRVAETSATNQEPVADQRLSKFAENAEKTLIEIKNEFQNFLSSTNDYASKLNDKLSQQQPPKTYRCVSIQCIPVDDKKEEQTITELPPHESVHCQCDDVEPNVNKAIESSEKYVQANETFQIVKEDRSTQCEAESSKKETSTNTDDVVVTKEEPRSKSVKDKSCLVQQSMPKVNIPAGLVIQRTLDLEIKPCAVTRRNPSKPNTVYKEFKHADAKPNAKCIDDKSNKKVPNPSTKKEAPYKYPVELLGKNADWPDVDSEEGHHVHAILTDQKNRTEVDRKVESKTDEEETPNKRDKSAKKFSKDSSPSRTASMNVLAIIEDGRSIGDIVSKSVLALQTESLSSTDSTKVIEQENIMDIIKDGKLSKIQSLREYGQVNKGRSVPDASQYKNTHFEDLDVMLKTKIDRMMEHLPSFDDNDIVSQREIELATIDVNNEANDRKDGETKLSKQVSAMKKDGEKKKPMHERLTIVDDRDTLSIVEMKPLHDIAEQRSSSGSLVSGMDVGLQCSLLNDQQPHSIDDDVSQRCYDECAYQFAENPCDDAAANVTQASKSIQTSSSASLALMFNEKLIEKLKTLPHDPRGYRPGDVDNETIALSNFERNIDGYKMPNGEQRRTTRRKQKLLPSPIDENNLQPVKFNAFCETSGRMRCGKDGKSRDYVKPRAISLDTNLANNNESSACDSYSEGEIKCCRCSASIGEVHPCKLGNVISIKSNVQYLKNHPDEFMQYEHADNTVKVLRKRIVNDNWHTYYLTSTSSSQ